ncbi:MAG TPA: 7-carboxy-7-deazaguanine synthase [Acetobacteraceae bacterium]|nr:7-carboxy-7-deazaguanine synthase [Acetobacteraceae bacterium]
MSYAVKEIFYTLQGEGRNAGRAAVFCRFAGCNLWSGREADRATAVCRFCDTDFIGTDGEGGSRFVDAQTLARAIGVAWRGDLEHRLVVLTGGEPFLQVNEVLIEALHELGFEVAAETNGTIKPPQGIDWLCVSPKADAPLVATEGDELKLVFPQQNVLPARFEGLKFQHFLIQPMDGPDRAANIEAAVAFCLDNPNWRLSLQTHKYLGIP